MSATAIAQVTVALKELLKANLDSTVNVSLLQPSDTLAKNSVNLYLYRVVENAQLKNTDWRGDRAHPGAPFPALALELHYLLTPFADPPQPGETKLPEAHTLLGAAMQVFHDHPVVNDVHTAAFDFDTLVNIDDLRNAFDQIIVRLQGTSTEELSKIWMMFNQPYRLSVAYQVSLVQIAPTTPAPARSAPVMVTGLDVFPIDPPGLAALEPPRAGAGGALVLRGHRLARKSFATRVTFGGQAVEPTSVSESQVQISVPVNLDAGPEQQVRVLLDGQASAPLTYVLSPWLRRLEPERGAPGATALPVILEVLGEDLLTAAGVTVTFRGAVVPHTVADGTHLGIIIAATEPNGFHAVRVTANGQTSNARTLEVIPRLDVLVPAVPVVGSPLTLQGLRLDGTVVWVKFGPATVVLDTNATATQVQVPRVPRLDLGTYDIRVTVDGHESNPLPFTVT